MTSTIRVPRIVSDIMWLFHKRHGGMSKLPAWRKASEDLATAKRTGSTQAIHRARKEMRKAVLDDLRRV